MMAKPEWGAKRVCRGCGTRFYDMKKDPIVCPSCEAEYQLVEPLVAKKEAKAAKKEAKKPVKKEVVEEEADIPEDELEDLGIDDDDIDLDDDDADDTVMEDTSDLEGDDEIVPVKKKEGTGE